MVVRGGCRTLRYLAAASPLVTSPWTSPALLPGLVLGAYIVGLSLIARQESRRAEGVSPAVWPLLLLLVSPVLLSLYQAAQLQKTMPVAVGIGLILWLSHAVRRMRSDPPRSIGPAVGKLLAGIAWVDALAVAPSHPRTALLFVALVPLLRLWQRHIAAT